MKYCVSMPVVTYYNVYVEAEDPKTACDKIMNDDFIDCVEEESFSLSEAMDSYILTKDINYKDYINNECYISSDGKEIDFYYEDEEN